MAAASDHDAAAPSTTVAPCARFAEGLGGSRPESGGGDGSTPGNSESKPSSPAVGGAGAGAGGGHRDGRSDELQALPSDAGLALVPFSYNSPFHDSLKLEERLFDLGVGKMLRIRQHWKPDGKGGSKLGFGASVYNCAFVLGEYLCRHRHLIHDKRVVELGSGLGLTSIGVALAGAKRVWATDGDEELLEATKANAAANAAEAVADGRLHVQPLFWGNHSHTRAIQEGLGAEGGDGCADVVIAADVAACVYEEAFRPLCSTLLDLCGPCGVVYLAYKTRHSSEVGFFGLADRVFDSQRVPSEDLHPDFQEDTAIRLLKLTPKNDPDARAAAGV